jgi:hypothetical protein
VLELTKAGDVEMTLADVCEHVDKGGLEALMRDLSNEEVEVGTATAAALLERNAYGFDNLVARGRFSQEALDLVARTARSSTTRGYALVRLEDVEAVKEALTGRDPDMLGSALRFEVGRVNDLLGAGLEEDLVLALYANADHYGGRRQAPSAELLELVARRGTSSHFRGHSFSTAQVPLLLERLKETSGSRVKDSVIGALLGWFESTTSKVREGSGLTEEELTLRARFLREGGWSVRASALEGGNLEPGELTALSQVLEGDELTGFVQTAQNLGAARHNTSSERGRAVLKEAMALTALDWGAMGTTAAELVHEEFTSAFGDDVRLWEAALTLMESWDAPLADLVAVVKEF